MRESVCLLSVAPSVNIDNVLGLIHNTCIPWLAQNSDALQVREARDSIHFMPDLESIT